IKCCCIDIVLPGPGNEKQLLIDRLIREFKAGISDKDTIIAYRGNYRLVRTFEPIRLSPLDSQPPALRLKKAGVYLITGGLGGIGLVLARYLAKTLQAKLILTGRSAFPARQEWDQWLNTHHSLDSVSQKIRKVKELEALGAEVQVYSVDAADEPGMRNVVQEAKERFGTINGVIHSAGVPGGGMIQLKTREMADQVLAPKVKGTLALDQVLQDQGIRPDLIVLCSSVNSVVPILGQVDYFAANAFMDAFAFYNNAKDNTFTVSINWDAWQEVGMAVEAARRLAGDNYQKTSEPQPIDHPLLDHYVTNTPRGEMIYSTYFSLNRHWVLQDHRTNEGRGLIPGVAYLEMAHAAMKNQVKQENEIVEIRSVFFLNPFIVEKGEEKEARMILTPSAAGFEFQVSSRLTPGENTWQDHVKGEVAAAALQEEEPKTHDLQAIEARCNLQEIDVASSWSRGASGPAGSLIIYGPRWANLKKIKAGKNEGLALMELPAEFTSELNQFTLYPAIMDHASFFLYSCINPESRYIPYSYKRLRVSAPFPARVYTYSRWLEEGEDGAPKDFLEFNIIIMDETGRELVNIEEFTMLEISPEILEKLKEKEHGALPGSTPAQARGDSEDTHQVETSQEELVKDGISPLEGVEIFTRILETKDALPQVVVSTRDLGSRLEASQIPESPDAADWIQGPRTTSTVHARPDISTPYIAPATSLEQKIANIWQELLGIQQVGIKDDFFELGGDSLKAASLIAKIRQEFNTNLSVRNIFNSPNVKDLSKLIEIPGEADVTPAVTSIKPIEKKEYYVLSAMQRRMYILNKMEGIGTTYNLAVVVRVNKKLHRQRLDQVFRLLIHRHESLRTSFDMKDGEPVQIIHDADDVDSRVEYLDYQGEEEKIPKLIRGFIRPFNLIKAPLIRVGIITLSEEKHVVILDVHHIVTDGTSYMAILKNIDDIYEGRELPGLIIQYKEFSVWHNREMETDLIKKQELHWINEFKAEIPVLNLPTDYSRPALQVYEGSTQRFTVNEEKNRKLKALALKENATPFMVLLGIFYAFLSKLSGQEDIVVGSPVAGRRFAELMDIVGMFINMLPLRNYPTSKKTFKDFLKEIKEKTLEALDNQEYPYELLLEELPIKRDLSRNLLFDVVFDLQNELGPDLDLGNLVEYDTGISKYDLTLTVMEAKERLECRIEYCTRLFKAETIEKFIRYFNKTFSFLVENPGAVLREIELLAEEEKQQILLDFNDTETTYPKDKTLQRLFEEQAGKTPDHVALIGKMHLS
ncbi:MAG: SDR family NAD(P)-dependent oxidoreductase, partial [Candidatus Aminicenantes bacterium]